MIFLRDSKKLLHGIHITILSTFTAMKKLTISVITPTFNQAEFIPQTFESVLTQQSPHYNLEYIVYDGGSTDGTKEIAEQYAPLFAKANISFQYTREKDSGQSDAINKGWKEATGDILTYLNSDDYYETGTLEKVASFFKEHPQQLWAYGGFRYVNRYGWEYATVQPEYFSYEKLLDYCPIGQPSCFFRKELLSKVGMLNQKLHLAMDYDLWLRFARKAPAGILYGVLSNMRYYAAAKSGAKSKEHLDEAFALASSYTKAFSRKRVVQWLYYMRGLAVILLGIDITRRVQWITPQ